ncbi:endonuclease, partial [Streptomyces halstedii]|uniref:endonuclease n=1 Tax=Streptomyces halstedii TaxID=1944 RepID=UPI00341531D3
MKTTALILAAFPAAISLVCTAAPATFDQAKVELRERVYFDRNLQGDTYCGCTWRWVGRTGGRIDPRSCGYEVRALPERAARIEYEHITPAWSFGHQRQCWQNGGRKNCVATDPVFRAMEADAHNLTVVVGEVNADRSHYNYAQLSKTPYQYGACATRVDFNQRAAEPRNEAKGLVARVQLYMHDWYGLRMSRQQQQLFTAWDRMYPPSDWELERDRRIAKVMGHSNPYVTGELGNPRQPYKAAAIHGPRGRCGS